MLICIIPLNLWGCESLDHSTLLLKGMQWEVNPLTKITKSLFSKSVEVFNSTEHKNPGGVHFFNHLPFFAGESRKIPPIPFLQNAGKSFVLALNANSLT